MTTEKADNEANLSLVHWGVQDALYQAEQAMDDLLQNLQTAWLPGC